MGPGDQHQGQVGGGHSGSILSTPRAGAAPVNELIEDDTLGEVGVEKERCSGEQHIHSKHLAKLGQGLPLPAPAQASVRQR